MYTKKQNALSLKIPATRFNSRAALTVGIGMKYHNFQARPIHNSDAYHLANKIGISDRTYSSVTFF